MKTTIIGVLIILGALANALLATSKGQAVDMVATAGLITTGIGLIAAKDNGK